MEMIILLFVIIILEVLIKFNIINTDEINSFEFGQERETRTNPDLRRANNVFVYYVNLVKEGKI